MENATIPASGSRFSDLEMGAWAGFLRAHAMLVRELDDEVTQVHGLPLSSYDVLVQLEVSEDGRLRLSQLADAVLLSRSGLSRLVQRLIDQGLVERIDCTSDARGAFASITDRGRERLAEARATHRAGVRERFLDKLTDDQKRQLAEIWETLGAANPYR